MNKKTVLIILLILTVFLFIYSYELYDFNKLKTFVNPTGRFRIHQEAWKYIQQRPLIGWGYGTYEYLIGLNPVIVQKLAGEQWRELHDEYGQIWFATGLIGLIIYLGLIISTFIRFLRKKTDEGAVLAASLIAFLIISLTLFPMRVSPTAFYAVIFTGLLLNVTKEETE